MTRSQLTVRWCWPSRARPSSIVRSSSSSSSSSAALHTAFSAVRQTRAVWQALAGSAIRVIDTVVFDKTGTPTAGRLTVTSVSTVDGWARDEVLALAAAVESASEHAVAMAIDTAAPRSQQLRDRGQGEAMVGDGINDGPALACADLGLATGRGNGVAVGAADIILVRQSVDVVPQALEPAKATLRAIKVNMVSVFWCNVAAIPIAVAGLLNPLIAGAAMALSLFFVVSNSLRLYSFSES